MDGSTINKSNFESELFELAKKYVSDNKLEWKISPPTLKNKRL